MERVEVDDFTDFLELPASLRAALSAKRGEITKNPEWQRFYVPRRLIWSGCRHCLITEGSALRVDRELGVPSRGVHNSARSYAATYYAYLCQLRA